MSYIFSDWNTLSILFKMTGTQHHHVYNSTVCKVSIIRRISLNKMWYVQAYTYRCTHSGLLSNYKKGLNSTTCNKMNATWDIMLSQINWARQNKYMFSHEYGRQNQKRKRSAKEKEIPVYQHCYKYDFVNLSLIPFSDK